MNYTINNDLLLKLNFPEKTNKKSNYNWRHFCLIKELRKKIT